MLGDALRFTTWLAPGLPMELFDTIADHVSRGLGRPYELVSEPKISGPMSAEDDRFATGLTDVGFICPPAYLWLVRQVEPTVTLVPLAPVHDDPRNDGRPVYVSDVVVRSDSGIGSFMDLEGRRVGFNEKASLSGFVSLMARLDEHGLETDFFGELRQVGSHRRALDLIEAGDIDGAAIDANVWRAWQHEHGNLESALRSVDVLGPNPVQPVVVRASAGPDLVDAVTEQLAKPELAAALRPYGVTGFAPIDPADYLALTTMVDRAMTMAGLDD